MSRRAHRLTPIERFLGPAAATGSPFDLLGVSPESADEREVQAALRRRLSRLGLRSDANTPEAGEVRLALHAAAAQLCDPRVRAHLQRLWVGGAGEGRPVHPAASAIQSRPVWREAPRRERRDAIDTFRASALRVLARGGGWNRRTRRRIAALAHAMGLQPAALALALRATRGVSGAIRANGAARSLPVARVEMARTPAVAGAAQPTATRESIAQRPPTAPMRSARDVRRRIWLAGMATLALAFALLTAWILLRAAAPPRNAIGRSAESAPAAPAREGAPALADAAGAAAQAPIERAQRLPQRDAEVDFRRALLALTAVDIGSQPASRTALEALSTVASGWSGLSPEALRESALAAGRLWIVGGRVSAGRPGRFESPEAAQRAWFSAGADAAGRALARVGSQREALRAFIDGARASLIVAPGRLPPLALGSGASAGADESAATRLWSAWMRSATLLDGLARESLDEDDAARDSSTILALDALEAIMTRSSAGAEAQARAAIRAVAPLVNWRGEGGGARVAARRLLDWFEDSRVRADALADLTGALVDSQAIPGVRADMLLPAHAGRSPRLTLRDRYARLLNVETFASPRALPATWRREALEALRGARGGGATAALRDAAFFARLNSAAALRWAGDTSASAQITANIHDDIERLAAGDAAVDRFVPLRDNRGGDGEWAARILSAGRNVEEKARALFDVEGRSAPLGPADADALALAAVSDLDANIQARAQRLVVRLMAQPTVLNGLLESLPHARRTLSVAGLVEEVAGERLPPPESEQWLPQAQRALAQRLLGALEQTAAGKGVDDLADAIEAAHASLLAALAPQGGPDGANPPSGAGDPRREGAPRAAAFALLKEAAQAGAGLRPGGAAPGDLERRWRVRAELAAGPAQRTASWSTAMAEALGLLAQAERPSQGPASQRVLALLAVMQSAARTSAEQIALAESAQTALWMLRFGDPEGAQRLETAAAGDLRGLASASAGGASAADPSSPWMARARTALKGSAWDRFNLAEEIADAARSPSDRALARDLYAASLATGVGPGVRSVSLALRELATSDAERDWLLGLADAAADDSPDLADWRRVGGDIDGAGELAGARFAAALALLRYQGGDRGEAREIIESTPGAEAALHGALHGVPGRGAAALLEDMRSEPTCRQCHNRRYVKTGAAAEDVKPCPVCLGDPGPDLDGAALAAVLRAELELLGVKSKRWSSTLRGQDMQPLPVLDPSLIQARYGVEGIAAGDGS